MTPNEAYSELRLATLNAVTNEALPKRYVTVKTEALKNLLDACHSTAKAFQDLARAWEQPTSGSTPTAEGTDLKSAQ